MNTKNALDKAGLYGVYYEEALLLQAREKSTRWFCVYYKLVQYHKEILKYS